MDFSAGKINKYLKCLDFKKHVYRANNQALYTNGCKNQPRFDNLLFNL